jgi:hypothetical protein
MINELRVGSLIAPTDPRGTWALGFPAASVTVGHFSWDCMLPNNKDYQADDCEGCIDRCADGMGACVGCPYQQGQARSRHNGVAAALCDGSVRFVTNAITQRAWWYLNASDDGNPNDPD